jgi:hypothetical protein
MKNREESEQPTRKNCSSCPRLPAFAQELRRAWPLCRVEAEGVDRSRASTLPQPPMSSPGLTGRSGTPGPIGSSAVVSVSGILDRPLSRAMTTERPRWLAMTSFFLFSFFFFFLKNVDGRDKPGHDDWET